MSIQTVLFAFSLLLTLPFFLYGFNHYFLLGASARYRTPRRRPAGQGRPGVAIHLPLYNEKYVIRRLVDACARMAGRYGAAKVRILLLDDSDDDTRVEVDQVAADYVRQGFRVEVLRRGQRSGFKAGALQEALNRAEEDYIAIFDADFIPQPDFLVRAMPYLTGDRRIGIVQSRWTHLNRDYNFVTRAIAIAIDVHFLIEQAGRYAAGCFLSFNGSGGIFRKSALLEAGGWQADTLAEDMDASYRIQILGYKLVFLKDLLSPAEVPPTVPSFKKQQGRWACGSLRAARKILPLVFANRKIGGLKRLQAFIHLTNYILHPLMLLSFVLACLTTLLQAAGTPAGPSLFRLGLQAQAAGQQALPLAVTLQNLTWGLLTALTALCAVSAWVYPLAVLRSQKQKILPNLPSLLVLFFLGCGISLNNTIEAAKALLSNRTWAFRRTPKYALRRREGWKEKSYQVPLDFTCLLELALVCFGGTAIGFAAGHANFTALGVLAPYTLAYAFVFLLTIRQSRPRGAA